MGKEGLGQKPSTELRFKSQLCLVLYLPCGLRQIASPPEALFAQLQHLKMQGDPTLPIHALCLVTISIQLLLEQLVVLGSEGAVV